MDYINSINEFLVAWNNGLLESKLLLIWWTIILPILTSIAAYLYERSEI